MFSLSEHIDDVIEFGGGDFAIDMSFDNIINVQNLILDPKEDNFFKVAMTVTLLLDLDFEEIIEHFDIDYLYETFERLLEHIGFKNKSGDESEQTGSEPQRVFDYEQDAEAIYASFFYAYQLDLIDVKGQLHYFKFRALLENLPEDASLSKIIGYRTMKIPTQKEASKEYISHVKKMKQLYKLDGGGEVYEDPDKFDYGGFRNKLKG